MYAVADGKTVKASELGDLVYHRVVPEVRGMHGRVAREARVAELVSTVQLVAAVTEVGYATLAVRRLGKLVA
jgi:hypothetical protein